MRTDDPHAGLHNQLERRKPICGVICALFSILSITQVFVFNESLAVQIELFINDIQPFIVLGLAAAAIIRRERLIWPIIGILLSGFYVALHFVA